jgi:hypothetical protein
MNCRKAGPLLIGYLEGSLDNKTYSELNDHLGTCKNCSNDLYELSVMENMIHSSFPSFDDQMLLDDVMQSIKDSALISNEAEQDDKPNVINLDFINQSSVASDFLPPEFKKGFWYSMSAHKGLLAAAAFIILLAIPVIFSFVRHEVTPPQDMQTAVIKKALLEQLRTYHTIDDYVEEVHDFSFSGTSEAVPVDFLLGYSPN